MKFRELAKYLEKLEKTSSRNEITRILADLFTKADASELDKITYLLLGRLAPAFKGVVFNMADKMLIKAIAKAYGQDSQKVLGIYKKTGDLGTATEQLSNLDKFRKTDRKLLSVSDVYGKLLHIAKDAGEGSQERKIGGMAGLFSGADPLSARFIARIPVGRLRLGFSDKTVIDALSFLLAGDKSAKPALEKVYQVLPDVGLLAKRSKEQGIGKVVAKVKPEVGVPVLPMLAQRIKGSEEMIKKMGKVSVEPKLDGLRLSLHFKSGAGGFVKAFTRNLNENSWMFPELNQMQRYIDARKVILDCEAVGLDEETKQLANFQETMTRRRKHEIEAALKKVGIEFYVFDILSKDGRNLMDESYIKRREILERTLKPGNIFKIVDYELTDDPKRITAVYEQRIKQGLEGVIVKKADSAYVPGRTGFRWVKMKQSEKSQGKLSDTLDAIVMGYTLGKGRRVGFGLGQFLVGVADGEKIKTTTKIGTGLTDEQFRQMKKRLTKLEVGKKPKEYEVHKNYIPDYWVTPSLVVEIAADEITKSPTHSAGLALRFPRLIRFRDDKAAFDATTLRELQKLFEMQRKKM